MRRTVACFLAGCLLATPAGADPRGTSTAPPAAAGAPAPSTGTTPATQPHQVRPAAKAPTTRPTRPRSSREKYENAYVASKLAKHGLVPDPRPEGKIVEKIIVETDDVFGRFDRNQLQNIPILSKAVVVANYLHTQTRPYIAAREVLFQEGEPFRTKLAQETQRNLRAIIIFSIARVVACKGSRPDRVKVLVVTKDRWSLRLNTDFQVAGGIVDYLRVELEETNLAGRYKRLGLIMGLTRDTFFLGQGFDEPRLFGTRIGLYENASVIFGRGGRGFEGGTASLTIGQPLWSLATRWAYQLDTNVDVRVQRLFLGSDFFRCFSPYGGVTVVCDNQIATLEEREQRLREGNVMAPIWRSRVVNISGMITRRFGQSIKHDVSWGWALRHRAFELLGDFPSPGVRDEIATRFVPRSENASLLFASYNTFEASFVTLRNLARMATTEDFQIGHNLRATARWANKLFGGFDNPFLELDAVAQYRWNIGPKNLLTLYGQAQTRVTTGGTVNTRFAFQLNNVSPILGWGRLIFDAVAIFRFEDQDNVRSTIGGNSGLRGYENDQFRGRHLVNLHLEYRTLPIDLATAQLGLVAFWDSGHAADELSLLKLKHSLGVGLRIFFPQINTMVLRIDLGFPFNDGAATFGRRLSISFGQAF